MSFCPFDTDQGGLNEILCKCTRRNLLPMSYPHSLARGKKARVTWLLQSVPLVQVRA